MRETHGFLTPRDVFNVISFGNLKLSNAPSFETHMELAKTDFSAIHRIFPAAIAQTREK